MENSEKGEPNIRVIAAVIGLGMLLFAADATGIIGQGFEYDDYGAVLETYVNDQGMVAYEELKANREKLDAFATTIATLDPTVYDQWTENQKVAFWINAYNALTLQAIINHYPIKPSFFASIRFPKNSIRQIPGVWDELQFAAMGRKMTLDEIEHEILRKNFNEPRIHMALVCAAMGCPPLRNEPFTGDRLDAQLDDQTRRFLENPQKFRIDPVNGRVYLSPIFKWFGRDFIKTYGTGEKFSGKSETDRAVLNFISGHIDESVAKYLATGEYDLEYLDYDWSLNEQKGK